MFEKHPEEDEVIETIEEIMDEREERGDDVLVDKDEMLLLKNMFKLRDKRASEVALPRAEISALSLTAKPDEIKKIIDKKEKYLIVFDQISRFNQLPLTYPLILFLASNFTPYFL